MATYWGGRAKPGSVVARPNLGHKLAQGLLEFYAVPDSYYLRDAMRPSGAGITLGVGTRVDTEGGAGLKATNSGIITLPNQYNYAAGDLTINYIFRWDVVNAGAQNQMLYKTSGEFGFFLAQATGNINTLTIGGSDVTGLSSSAALVAGSVYMLTVTRIGTAGVAYINGKKDTTFTSSAVVASAGTLQVNGDGSRGAVPQSTFISWAYWNRGMSPSEVAELAMDPYLPLRPQRSRLKAASTIPIATMMYSYRRRRI